MIRLYAALLATLVLSACDDSVPAAPMPDAGDPAVAVCAPGSQRACSCANGTEGRASCLDDGSDFGACACEDVPCTPETGCASACEPHGTLDTEAGVCACDEGYIEGDQGPCTRCAPGFAARAGVCVSSVCGQGTLGQTGCVCDAGWQTSAEGPCAACATGFHARGDVCVPDLSCGPHGSSDDGLGCTCDVGYTNDATRPDAPCSLCEPGFHDEAGACVPDPDCGLHGWAAADWLACTCASGWADDGDEPCATCATGFHLDDEQCVPDADCSGRGTPIDGGQACQCDQGFADAAWHAPRHCSVCAAGYTESGDDCVPRIDCGVQGAPSPDGLGCVCARGWADDAALGVCAGCAPGYHREGDGCVGDIVCGAHGSSLPGGADCRCDVGYVDDPLHPTTAPCARCAEGFHEDGELCLPDPDCGPHGSLTADRRDCTCERAFIDDARLGRCRRVRPFPGPCRMDHHEVIGEGDYHETYGYDAYGREIRFEHDGRVGDWERNDDIIDGRPEYWRDTTYSTPNGMSLIEVHGGSRRRDGAETLTRTFRLPSGQNHRIEWYERYATDYPMHLSGTRDYFYDAQGRLRRTEEYPFRQSANIQDTTWTETATTLTRYTVDTLRDGPWWRETFDRATGRPLRYETFEATVYEYLYDPWGRIEQIDQYGCTHRQNEVTERFRYTYLDLPSGGVHAEEDHWRPVNSCAPIRGEQDEKWTREYDAAGNLLVMAYDPFGGRFPREVDTYTYACWDWCSDGSPRDPVTGCPPPADLCDPNPCGENAACTAQYGTFDCACADDYEGDPRLGCTAIPHPCMPNPCGSHAACSEQGAQFTCTCEEGYEGDPLLGCSRFDPCAGDPCADPAAQCQAWSLTEHICVCPPGSYDVHADGSECRTGEGYSRLHAQDAQLSTGALVPGPLGEVIMVGSFDGTLRWGQETATSQAYDAYAASFDVEGNLRWLFTLGGAANDAFESAAVLPDGGVVLVGSFAGSVTVGGTTLTASGQTDGLVLQLDAAGQLVSWRQLGGSNYDFVSAVALDGAGGLFLGGTYAGQTTLGTIALPAPRGRDLFIAHLTAEGSFDWAHGFGAGGSESVATMVFDGGALTVSGIVERSTDLGGGVLPTSFRSAFLARYDAAGVHRWSQVFSRASGDYSGDPRIALAPGGDVVMTSWFMGGVTVGTHQLQAESPASGVFVARFDSAGAPRWVTATTSPNNKSISGIAVAQSGEVHLGGSLVDSLNVGDASIVGDGAQQMFVATLAEDGVLSAAETYGGNPFEDLSAVCLDSEGALVAASLWRGPINLGWGPLTGDVGDLLLVRWPPP